MTEFKEWPKIARLNREMVVTEKIDGTNGCIIIEEIEQQHMPVDCEFAIVQVGQSTEAKYYAVSAQSRSRLITPQMDNHGFATWVEANVHTLIADLGPGYHFGEWAGAGIGKRYPGYEKRFWLFNTKRWSDALFSTPRLGCVPRLFEGLFSSSVIMNRMDSLREYGSVAYPGCKAEGVVAYHKAANFMFKVTVDKDDEWKGKK
jgi:hypothetical protein